MSERILYERTEPQPDRRVVGTIIGEPGNRSYLINGAAVATEGDDQTAKMARFVMEMSLPASIAWIGGGFCIGPRLVVALCGADQIVYEIEPALAEFCPKGATFIPGDYRTTLTGKYDVIVYDLGGEVPDLTAHLNPGGMILPKE